MNADAVHLCHQPVSVITFCPGRFFRAYEAQAGSWCVLGRQAPTLCGCLIERNTTSALEIPPMQNDYNTQIFEEEGVLSINHSHCSVFMQ